MSALSIELCLYRFSEKFELSAELINALAVPQQQHLKDLSSNRQKEYCVGRLLLTGMLKCFYGLGSNDWGLQERQGLPPLLSLSGINKAPGWLPKFSISHSGNIVAVAMIKPSELRNRRLGLDIETVNHRRKINSANYFCSQHQFEELSRSGDINAQHSFLTRIWTQKEAYFKAHELPILNPQLKNLSILNSETKPGELSTSWINAATSISIYCNAPHSINAQWVSIDRQGNFEKLTATVLTWESHSTAFLDA